MSTTGGTEPVSRKQHRLCSGQLEPSFSLWRDTGTERISSPYKHKYKDPGWFIIKSVRAPDYSFKWIKYHSVRLWRRVLLKTTIIFLKAHLSAPTGRLLQTELAPLRVSAQCPARSTAPRWRPTPAPHSATTTERHWTPPDTHTHPKQILTNPIKKLWVEGRHPLVTQINKWQAERGILLIYFLWNQDKIFFVSISTCSLSLLINYLGPQFT